MDCPSCGSSIKKKDKFCKACGLEISQEMQKYNYGGFLGSLIGKSAPIIVIMNYIGWITAIVWLLLLGQWQLLIFAFIVAFVFPFFYSLLMLVQTPVLWVIQLFIKKHHKYFGLVAMVVIILIGYFVDYYWMLTVFGVAMQMAGSLVLLPFLLLGYSVAVGPYQYMASKEGPDSINSQITTWLLSVSYIILMINFYLGLGLLGPLFILILVIMVISYLVKTTSIMIDEAEAEEVLE